MEENMNEFATTNEPAPVFTKGLGDVVSTRELAKLMSTLSGGEICKRHVSEAEAVDALNLFKAAVTQVLKSGAKIQITGFLNFYLTYRAARKGNNVFTKEEIEIPENVTVSVKIGQNLKEVGKQMDYEMVQKVKALKDGKQTA